jgi:hypothetical protein
MTARDAPCVRSADGAHAPRGFRFVAKDLRRSEPGYGPKRLQEAEREEIRP